jgi:hypothetical protein
LVMRRHQRLDGGRLEAWKAALDHLRENRALVAQVAGVVLGSAVVINLPFVPGNTYIRGLTTGILFVTFLWIMSWFTWVTIGLAFRIQGTFAQEAVSEQLRDSEHVYDVVASLQFGARDVDQVMITRLGITAVETKWHSRRPSEQTLRAAADQAAAGARSIRNTLPSLKTAGMPVESVTAALVLCGPGSRAISSSVMTTGLGPVEVVTARDLDKWLRRGTSGPVGRDFAEQLAREFHLLAQTRDEAAVKAGPLLRWLSRLS